jgi:hypothetical protein
LRDAHKTGQFEQYIAEFPPVYIIPMVDGFVCRDCPEKSVSSKAKTEHGNNAHGKKRVLNEEMFWAARLQSWFGEKRERYWAVHEGQGIAQERQARRAAIGDVGEESNSEADASNSSNSDDGSRDSQDDGLSNSLDEIIKEIEGWKVDAYKRRMEALKKRPAAKIDAGCTSPAGMRS